MEFQKYKQKYAKCLEAWLLNWCNVPSPTFDLLAKEIKSPVQFIGKRNSFRLLMEVAEKWHCKLQIGIDLGKGIIYGHFLQSITVCPPAMGFYIPLTGEMCFCCTQGFPNDSFSYVIRYKAQSCMTHIMSWQISPYFGDLLTNKTSYLPLPHPAQYAEVRWGTA